MRYHVALLFVRVARSRASLDRSTPRQSSGLELGSAASPSRPFTWKSQVSQVPRRTPCEHALLLPTPAWRLSIGCLGVAAAFHPNRRCRPNGDIRNFGARSHSLFTRCLRFAPRVTPRHARLASSRAPPFAGQDSDLSALVERFPIPTFALIATSSSFPFPKLLGTPVRVRCNR
jgi:hypothetical protein